MKRKILIMVDWFLPGYKAGGPIRACYNLAMLLKDQYDIYIFTSDRDLMDSAPYQGVIADEWIDFDPDIHIYYASPVSLGWGNIRRQIRHIGPSAIYLNSMFSRFFTIYPLLLKMGNAIDADVVLSPRGMLKKSALASKSLKKKPFLALFKLLDIQHKVSFHATDEEEEQDIRRIFGNSVKVDKVLDVPPIPASSVVVPIDKQQGALKLLFIGRIHPIKNLHFILNCLKDFKNNLTLTIIGPVEDSEYFEYCHRLAGVLPLHIKVQFIGDMPHAVVRDQLLQHHFMVLPTLGENYGYAIVESFGAGRPVIISDRTPWKDLAIRNMGWDLPLDDEGAFLEAMNSAAGMNQSEYSKWCVSSLEFARNLSDAPIYRREYSHLFDGIGVREKELFLEPHPLLPENQE